MLMDICSFRARTVKRGLCNPSHHTQTVQLKKPASGKGFNDLVWIVRPCPHSKIVFDQVSSVHSNTLPQTYLDVKTIGKQIFPAAFPTPPLGQAWGGSHGKQLNAAQGASPPILIPWKPTQTATTAVLKEARWPIHSVSFVV